MVRDIEVMKIQPVFLEKTLQNLCLPLEIRWKFVRYFRVREPYMTLLGGYVCNAHGLYYFVRDQDAPHEITVIVLLAIGSSRNRSSLFIRVPGIR